MLLRKDADATLDYGLDWGAPDEAGVSWLGDDAITASTWRATGCDIAAVPPPRFEGSVTKVWLKGGVAGERAEVVNRVTTAGGRVDERTLHIQIVKR